MLTYITLHPYTLWLIGLISGVIVAGIVAFWGK